MELQMSTVEKMSKNMKGETLSPVNIAKRVSKLFIGDDDIEDKIANCNKLVSKIAKKDDALLSMEMRGSDVEVSLESGTYLVTSNFQSYQQEEIVREIPGRNVTGHYLSASGGGKR